MDDIVKQALSERNMLEQKMFITRVSGKEIVPVTYDDINDTVNIGKYKLGVNAFSDSYVTNFLRSKKIKSALLTEKNQILFLSKRREWNLRLFDNPVVLYKNNGACLIIKPYKKALTKLDEKVTNKSAELLTRGFVAKKYDVSPLSVKIVFETETKEEKTEKFE